jgi:hypothetical protein
VTDYRRPGAFGSQALKGEVKLFQNKKVSMECQITEASTFSSQALEGKVMYF